MSLYQTTAFSNKLFWRVLEGQDKEPIPDRYITGEELGLYGKNKVPEYDPTQHPQYGRIKDIRRDKRDLVFALKMPSNTPSACCRSIEQYQGLR